MAYGNGPNTKPKQKKGNTMGGDTLSYSLDGGNIMGGDSLNQPATAPKSKGRGSAGYPKGFDSKPIPVNEQ